MYRFVSNEELSRLHYEKTALEKRQKAEKEHFRMYPVEGYRRCDYDIRKKGDHYESYNLQTGHTLFEGATYDECCRDLDEEFAS